MHSITSLPFVQASILRYYYFCYILPFCCTIYFWDWTIVCSSRDAVDHYYVNHLPIIFEKSHNENFSPLSLQCNGISGSRVDDCQPRTWNFQSWQLDHRPCILISAMHRTRVVNSILWRWCLHLNTKGHCIINRLAFLVFSLIMF